MFPLPFSISPLLLSILVFYPWALALGVWQVGLRINKSDAPRTSQVRTQASGVEGTGLLGDGRTRYTPKHADAEFFSAIDASFLRIPSLGSVGQETLAGDPTRRSCAPSAPRAPPTFS